MVPIGTNHGPFQGRALDSARSPGALSPSLVMTASISTRADVLANVAVRLSLRVLLLLGILPGGLVI
jgi:hypothetical protein